MRTLCDVDFTPPVDGETLRPTPPRSGAGLTVLPVVVRKTRRDSGRTVYGAGKPLRLAVFLEVTGPGGSGKSIMAEIAPCWPGRITPRRPPSRRWNPR